VERVTGEIAGIAKRLGGRALLVGGCVRDMLLGREPDDFDMEVFGVPPERLKAALAERFRLNEVGASFGILKLHGCNIDVALPRRETKLGEGHRAFGMDFDPGISVKEAAARRDFTVNAIYRDPLTGEIVDPWGGERDLRANVLRHVSEHFREDPLRVLRAMQFLARFDLDCAPETLAVCREMTPENLPPERLLEEWKKLIVKGEKISKGLRFLRDCGWVRYYPELAALIGCEQDPAWHPEGDVWNHTLASLDAFARQCSAKDADERFIIGLAVLCHDFGKPATTCFDRVKGRIRSRGHDEAGVAPTESFLRRLTGDERLVKEVVPLVRLHMRPYAMWKSKSGENAVRRLAAEAKRIDRLVQVCAADDAGRPPFPRQPEALDWLSAEAERLAVKDSAPKPVLMGRDLVALGMKPGDKFGHILRSAYSAQLDGKIRTLEDALEFIRRKTYIIWDWNGTLLDDTRAAFDTLNIMLAKRGSKSIEMDFYLDNFAFPVRPFYEAIGVVLENEDWDMLAQEYHDIYFKQPKAPNALAKAALEKASGLCAGQAILSALRQDLLVREVAHCGLGGYLDALAGVDNLDGASKLARGKALIEQLREEHPLVERFVMIGDALHDKEVADALGVECVLCPVGSHAGWRLEKVAPTAENLTAAVDLAMKGERK